LVLNSFRNICSTPQKQPAATVAFAAPSGMLMLPPAPGLRPMLVLEEKGRRMRDMKLGIVVAMRRRAMEIIRVLGDKNSLAEGLRL